MSIAEKLTTIAENEQKVFDAGEDKGRAQWIKMRAKGSADGFDNKYKVITAEDLEGITAISKYAFAIEGITSVTLPNGLLTIGESSFGAFLYIKTIVIPDSVTAIGDKAFNNCWYLKDITIGANVESIGNYAFNAGSDAIYTIYAETPPTIQASTFPVTANPTFYVPKGCTDAYKNATNWAQFADVIYETEE